MSSFWHMGGYGFYVWGSYGLVLLGLLGSAVLMARRHKQVLALLQEEGL